MTQEKQLDELLLQWEEGQTNGNPISPESLCADCPELLDELNQQIKALAALDPILAVTPAPGNSTITYDEQPAKAQPKELPTIPGYEIESELTAGGMGVVYKVRNLRVSRREEALKMIRPEKALSPHMIQRFKVEGDAIAQFEDPRIVRIYTTGEHEGRPFFTMEFVKGGSLADHLGRFQANQTAAVQLVAKVARAVHFMHTGEKKIIHRDLKPGNILLRESDEPAVGDFGLAKFFGQESEEPESGQPNTDSQLTQAGAVLGTPHYMSPEQAQGKKADEASDIWSLGDILYELLTGERPFLGKNNEEIRQAILNGEFKRPRELKPRIDKHLEAICLKCLKPEPKDRYQTAEAVAIALERWQDGYAILPEWLPKRTWRKARRHPRVLAGSILTFVILATLFLYPRLSHYLTLQTIRGKLAGGETVTLIGETGRPVLARFWMGENGAKTLIGEDGTFVVHGWPVTFLELLPDTGACRHYKIHAQIRHMKGGDSSVVGLYFACTLGSKRVPINFLHVYYDDQHDIIDQYNRLPEIARKTSPKPKANPVKLASLFCPFGVENPDSCVPANYFQPELFKHSGYTGRLGDWRTIVVEVAAKQISVRFDGKLVGQLLVKRVQQKTGRLLQELREKDSGNAALADIVTQIDLTGGLGVYLLESFASFRNVRVEPIPGAESTTEKGS